MAWISLLLLYAYCECEFITDHFAIVESRNSEMIKIDKNNHIN